MEIIIDDFGTPSKTSIYRILSKIPKKPLLFYILYILYMFFRRFSIVLNFKSLFPSLNLFSFISNRKKSQILTEELEKKTNDLQKFLNELPSKKLQFFNFYHSEIISMFDFPQLNDEKNLYSDQIKTELLVSTCFVLMSQRMLEFLYIIKLVLKKKYLEKFRKKYGETLLEYDEIMDYIVNEFYDSIIHQGLNNLSNYTRKNVISLISTLKENEEFDLPVFFNLLDQLEKNLLKFSSSCLEVPLSHKKWSSFSLSRRIKHLKVNNNKKITFTDFNVVSTEISEIEEEESEAKRRHLEENGILFAHQLPLTLPKNSLDLIRVFLGDIDNHKFFVDQDCIERFIIVADRNARAERYKCDLEEIAEESDYNSSNPENNSNKSESECNNSPCFTNKQIEEARYYFSLILKLFCGEMVDFIESSNYQIYIVYSIRAEFLKLKNLIEEDKINNSYNKFSLDHIFQIMNNYFLNIKNSEERLKKNLTLETNINFLKEIKTFKLLEKTEEQLIKIMFYQVSEMEFLNK